MSSQLNLSIALSAIGAGAAAQAVGQIGASVARLQQQIASASAVQDKLRTRIEAMRSSGAAAELLQRRYDGLTTAIERASAATDRLAQAQARINRHSDAIGLLKADAYAVVGLAASMAVPIKAAVDFESAMADVRKVVDGTDAEIAALGEAIKRMGREIPLAHTELAALAAAGGQLGVKLADLPAFVTTTAKMSVAFDMPAQEAGDAMAKVANVYAIPIREIGRLGDAINQISNESPAKAREVVNALSRVGGVARQFGLSAEQAAALSAALIAMGKPPEVAATGVNALLTKLATADKQGKSFQEGLAAIGVSAAGLKKAIQKDAQGALMAFLKRLEKLPKEQRMGVLVDLFGLEYADDIAALAGSLDVYRAQLAAVQSSAGSMNKEFAARAATTANNWQRLKNTLSELSIEVGSALLPAINSLIDSVRPAIEAAASWARANQPLVETIGKAVGALLLFKAGSLAASFAFHGVGYVMSSVILAFGKLRAAIASIGLAWQVFATAGLPLIKSFMVGLYMQGVLLAGSLKAVGAAVLAAGRAIMLTPIGLALAAIAGAAYLVWRHWDAIGPKLAAVWDMVKSGFDSVWAWLQGVPQRMMEIGGNIIDGLSAGIRSKLESVKAAAIEAAQGAVATVKGALGINSPSRVFAEIGGFMMSGMQQGIQRMADLPQSAMGAVASALAAPLAAGAITLGVSAAPALAAPEPIRMPQPVVAAPEPIRVPQPVVAAPEPIRVPQPLVAAPEPIRVPPPLVAAPESVRQDGGPQRAPMPAAAPINITINLNGPASPEAAQDVALAVRREVERLLADRDRQAAIARRAAMLDGGLA